MAKYKYNEDKDYRWEIDEDGDKIPGSQQIKCCGKWMECDGFTNTCEECGADYNWAGQRLASREQWGEETGESLSDILDIE